MTERERVLEVIAQYVRGLEARDGTAVAALFGANATFELADGSLHAKTPAVAMSVTGRDNIAAMVDGATASPGRSMHYLTSDHIVGIQDEDATFSSRFIGVESNLGLETAYEWSSAARMLQGSLALTMLGRYETRLSNVYGAWLITNHRVIHDLPLVMPAD